MPRTTEQIIADAEALARKFENADEMPDPAATRDGRPLREVREAFEDLAHAQRRLADRVSVAKASGHSWASIGMMLGTSGEAARQRYSKIDPAGSAAKKPAVPAAKAAAGKVVAVKTPGKKKLVNLPGFGGR